MQKTSGWQSDTFIAILISTGMFRYFYRDTYKYRHVSILLSHYFEVPACFDTFTKRTGIKVCKTKVPSYENSNDYVIINISVECRWTIDNKITDISDKGICYLAIIIQWDLRNAVTWSLKRLGNQVTGCTHSNRALRII